jgi:hypothetical protein
MQHQSGNSDKKRKAPPSDMAEKAHSSSLIAELKKKAKDTNSLVEKLRVDWREHAFSSEELRDYGPFMDALKKLVEYPKLEGCTYEPSKIELMVKEVHDKIQAEYKDDWEVYDSTQKMKREALTEAVNAARNAQVELHVAQSSAGAKA